MSCAYRDEHGECSKRRFPGDAGMLRVPNSDLKTGRNRWMLNTDGKCVQATPLQVLKWRKKLLMAINN